MSNIVTLDQIREAAERKYGATEVVLGEGNTVTLVNVMRLPKEKRDRLMEVQRGLKDDEDADQEAGLREILRLVAENDDHADRLLSAVGDDLASLVTVFELYSKGTELGEA